MEKWEGIIAGFVDHKHKSSSGSSTPGKLKEAENEDGLITSFALSFKASKSNRFIRP